MDKNEHSQKQKPPEKKTPPMGGNIIWYGLPVLIAFLFVYNLWWGGPPRVEIPIGDLVALIEQGAPDPEGGHNPSIVVVQRSGSKQQRVEYSELSEVTIGTYAVTGKITRRVLDSPSAETQRRVSFVSGTRGLERNNAELFNLLREKGFRDVSAEDPPGFWSMYGSILIFLLIVVPFFLFLLRRVGGAGGAIAFGRSRGKLFAQEDIDVTFQAVAGIDEAVDELREVVEFLRTPDKYRLLGGRIPRGVLLVGPPGTGKTLLAKAIAGEAGVPFFSISGSDFVEMFVGVGAARVRDMFQQAQARAPCIVFIDELDALGKTRGTSVVGGHDEREQTLNALLVEMDGFNSNSSVIVIAATNRPETLDPALLRPGRFDRHVLVDRPDIRGRESILKVHVKNVRLDESVNLAEIAAITSGFVGADLANLVNEAALLAARKNKTAVTMEEFNEAVERVTAGLEKRQRIISDEEKHRVAYHESAHALVAYSLPNTDPVHKVSIIPRGLAALGYTLQRPEGDRYLLTQSELESRIQVLLAGTVAEEMIFDDISTGAQNDLERATEIARSMVMDFGMSRLGRINYRESRNPMFLGSSPEPSLGRYHSEQTAREIDQEIKRIIDQALEKVRHILETRHKALQALAERLIDKEVIDTEELKDVIEANSPSPVIVPGTTDSPKRSATDTSTRQQRPQIDAGHG